MCYCFFMITIKEIQLRLREEIKWSGISQKELAEKLNINASTVSKYMRLDKYPSLETFANICESHLRATAHPRINAFTAEKPPSPPPKHNLSCGGIE